MAYCLANEIRVLKQQLGSILTPLGYVPDVVSNNPGRVS